MTNPNHKNEQQGNLSTSNKSDRVRELALLGLIVGILFIAFGLLSLYEIIRGSYYYIQSQFFLIIPGLIFLLGMIMIVVAIWYLYRHNKKAFTTDHQENDKKEEASYVRALLIGATAGILSGFLNCMATYEYLIIDEIQHAHSFAPGVLSIFVLHYASGIGGAIGGILVDVSRRKLKIKVNPVLLYIVGGVFGGIVFYLIAVLIINSTYPFDEIFLFFCFFPGLILLAVSIWYLRRSKEQPIEE
jgi:hypothetical protein